MLAKKDKIITTRPAKAAACATPWDSGQPVQMGQTESNVNNMENRLPIKDNRHEYDFFSYFAPATLQEAQQSGTQGGWPVLADMNQYVNYTDTSGATDPLVAGMMGKMFGYKPNILAGAFFMKYTSTFFQGADTLVKGTNPALSVPISPDQPVMMPDTGYSLGGNMEAMVVFAAEDRITLHIGRHEYIAGNPNQNNCNGKPCSGGYWIYIRGICVDQQIQNAYNQAAPAQNAAGADKTPINLPMIEAGRTVGNAIGNSVDVIVRDNGPLISVFRPYYWQGVPARDFGVIATPTPFTPGTPTPTVSGGGPIPTDTPVPPTATPTPIPPTPTPACGFGINQSCCQVPPNGQLPLGLVGNINLKKDALGTTYYCQIPYVCTQANNTGICFQQGVTATPTMTPTPTASPTPFPQPNAGACADIKKATAAKKITIVFLGFSGVNVGSQAQAAVAKFETVTEVSKILPYLEWKTYSTTQNWGLALCPDKAPDGKFKHCWNHEWVGKTARQCGGDVAVILAGGNEFPDEKIISYVDHQIAMIGSKPESLIHGLAHSIAQIADEYSYGANAPANTVMKPENCASQGCGKWNNKGYTGVQCTKGCGYDDWYRAGESIMSSFSQIKLNPVQVDMLYAALGNIMTP